MPKLPSREEIIALLERVLAKYSWTQGRLAKELNVGPHTISRWRKGSGMHRIHYEELLRLDADTKIEKINSPLQIPFSVTIPRASLRVVMDEDGNINIRGMLLAILDHREEK